MSPESDLHEARKSFHEQLDELKADVVRLGAMATESIGAGAQALLDADLAAVDAVIAADVPMDDLTHGIEERACALLALQQPMASDMRTIVTILRIIHELERAGDLMINVAKTARRIYPRALDPKVRGIIERMRGQAAAQVRLAVESFADADLPRAAALADMDDVMDDLQKDLFRTIFATAAPDEAALHQAVQIALVGRYFERIADHAVNIAERVGFMVTGELKASSELPNPDRP